MVLLTFPAIHTALTMLLVMSCYAIPGQRVYYRIHVPTKVRTIYHTKFIKVPEHHHYIHEKEKVVPATHHHYVHHEEEKQDNYFDNYDDDDDHEEEEDEDFHYEQAPSYTKYPIKSSYYNNGDYHYLKPPKDFSYSATRNRNVRYKDSKRQLRPYRVKHKLIKV